MSILYLGARDRGIGLTVSDPTFTIAQGPEVYRRNSKENDIRSLRVVVKQYAMGEVIIGLLKDLSGLLRNKAHEKKALSRCDEFTDYTSRTP
jgi:RNase H-fold protein (predicted Holliday junction resolvase)